MTKDMYKYIVTKTRGGLMKTIAISTYAGRTVRGVAICDPNDTYDEVIGKQIAAARCAAKIAQKRLNRATRKQREAEAMVRQANAYFNKMAAYYNDAHKALADATAAVDSIYDI